MEERVLLMQDGGRIGKNDGDYVEADAVPFDAGACRKSARRASDVLLLVDIDGAFRRSVIGGSARFHFDEDDQVALPGDNINFRIGSGAVVAGHDLIAWPDADNDGPSPRHACRALYRA